MSWFHDQCVGLAKEQPTGLWLCFDCRKFPTEIKHIKQEIDSLKITTSATLDAVQGLSSKLENCSGGISDKVTALSRQHTTSDKHTSDTLKTITNTTNCIKTAVEQKTNQILNKTSTVKVKLYSDIASSNIQPRTESPTNTKLVSQKHEQNQTSETSDSQQKVQQMQKKSQKKNNKQRKSDETSQNNENKKKQTRKRDSVENDDTELIDLTNPQTPAKTPTDSTRKLRQVIKQQTLLIGSSILKNVKISDLGDNIAVRTVSGATVETLKSKLDSLDIENCKTLIIHVGGNDASGGEELDTFRDNYETLLESVCDGTRRVIVSELLPRGDGDIEPYNEELRSLCADNAVEFVDNFKSFLLANGELPNTVFYNDKVHINAVGTRMLLANINGLHQIVRTSAPRAQHIFRYHNGSRTQNRKQGFQPYSPTGRYCHICSRNGGHSTQECWFNARNNGFPGRMR